MKKVILALVLGLVVGAFAASSLDHATKKADGTTVTTLSAVSDPGGGRP